MVSTVIGVSCFLGFWLLSVLILWLSYFRGFIGRRIYRISVLRIPIASNVKIVESKPVDIESVMPAFVFGADANSVDDTTLPQTTSLQSSETISRNNGEKASLSAVTQAPHDHGEAGENPAEHVIDIAAASGENGSCAICIAAFEKGESCRIITSCRHMYHDKCIAKWLQKSQHTCPLCRNPVF